MAGENETLSILSPLLDPIHGLLNTLQWMIGGVFGIYLAILIFNWWKGRLLIKDIKGLRQDVHDMREELASLKVSVDGLQEKKASHGKKADEV